MSRLGKSRAMNNAKSVETVFLSNPPTHTKCIHNSQTLLYRPGDITGPAVPNCITFPFDLVCLDKCFNIMNTCYSEPISVSRECSKQSG